MGWSLLPDALRPFKINCASPSITSQLVLFRNMSTGTCESCWSSLILCPKMRPRDIVRDSHSHSRCPTVSLPLRDLLRKGFISFPILYKWPFRPFRRTHTHTHTHRHTHKHTRTNIYIYTYIYIFICIENKMNFYWRTSSTLKYFPNLSIK